MNNRSPLHRTRLIVLLCTVLFFYGFYLGGVQLVIREVSEHYRVDLAGMGLLVSAQYIASILLPVVFGMIADRLGKKYVLCMFSAVFGIGCLFAGVSQGLSCYLLGAVLIGAGYSVCESVSSSVLSELDPEKSVQLINLSQGILSFGAVISPILLSFLRERFELSWRLPFLICAGAYALVTLLLFCTGFPHAETGAGGKSSARARYFYCRPFVFFFLSIIIYVGLENGFSFFAESLFSLRIHAPELGAAAISAYWIGMTVSRFVFGAFFGRPGLLLTVFFFAAAVFLAFLGVFSGSTVCVIICGFVGFAYGPIWSTLVGAATGMFPNASAGAAGLMSAGCGIGGMAAPILMGAVAGYDLSAAFLMLSGLALLGLVLSRCGCRGLDNPGSSGK